MKFLKRIYLIFFMIILFFFLVLWFFFITDRGVCWILRAVTYCVSGLKIGSISGNWLRGVTIKDLYYQNYGMLIRSSELYISLDLSYLWDKRLCVNSLFFKDFFVCINIFKLNRSVLEIDDNKKIIHIFRFNYPIVCSNITLNNVYIESDGMVVTLDKCDTGWIWNDKSFTIFPTFFSGLKILNFFDFIKLNVPFIHTVSLKDILFHTSSISHVFKSLSAVFSFNKENIKKVIPYNFILEKIEGENVFFCDQKHYLIKKLKVRGIFSPEYLKLTYLDMVFLDGNIHIEGKVKFDEECSVDAIIDFRSNIFYLGRERINVVISGGLRNMLCIYSSFSGVVNGQLIFKMWLDQTHIPLILTLNIDSLYCSFIDDFDCLIQGFNLNLSRDYYDYQVDLKFFISSSKLSFSSDVIMHGIANIDGLVISMLDCKSSLGVLNIGGIIHVHDFVFWDIQLFLKKINITGYSFIWPIDLCGEVNIKGNLSSGHWRFELFNVFLYGTIHDQHSVSICGSFEKNIFNEWGIAQVSLCFGSNKLKIFKDFKNNSLITGVIECVSLCELFPNLEGSIFGNINIVQNFRCSKIFLRLLVKSFHCIDHKLKIDHIFLRGDLQYDNILKGSLKCEIDHLMHPFLFLSKSVFQIIGDLKHHSIELSVCSNILDVVMIAYGSVDLINKDWFGSILKVGCVKKIINYNWDRILIPFYDVLPSQFVFFKNSLNKCFFRINFFPSLEGKGIYGWVHSFKKVHVILQQSFFLRSSNINGKFSFFIDLIWDWYNVSSQGKIFLLGEQVEWIYLFLGKSFFVIFENLDVNLVFNSEELDINWLIKVLNYGKCDGVLRILLASSKFSGNICVENISLYFLNIFLRSNDIIISGILNCCLEIYGDFFCPKINGSVDFKNLIIEGEKIPFMMKSSTLLLNFNECRALLDGNINSAHGKLRLFGDVYWDSFQSIYSRMNLIGYNVRLYLSPTINVDVSPSVVIEFSPAECIFKGTLDIPCGNIKLKEYLKYELDVSSDEIVISENMYNQDYIHRSNKSFFSNIINIRVRFGNNVRMNAFGLDTKLHGDLEIIRDKNGLGLKGHINISDGDVNIYGRNLFIKKGQLLFFGLMDHQFPYINLEAVRNTTFMPNSSVVGVRITGYITSPEIEIFSDSDMSQEQMLSYLLSGQILDTMNMNNNDIIRSILIQLGINHAEKFIDQFGRIFGVKDLILTTYGFGNSSQIVLSGFVTPDLQVKYGIGIFDPLSTVTVRYCLFRNFYFEIISGVTQTFDLKYQFNY